MLRWPLDMGGSVGTRMTLHWIAGVALLLTGSCGCPDAYRGSVAFDAAAWQGKATASDARAALPTRLQMVRSLHDQGLLRTGMTRTDVEALLGPPSTSSWNHHYPHPAWYVGQVESGVICDIDSAAIIVDFGDGDRLRSVRWPPGL